MHIGLITTSYPRFSNDIAGAFVRRAALEWVSRGAQVSVVAPRSDLPKQRRPDDPGVRVFEAPTPNGLFYGPGTPERLEQDLLTTLPRIPLALGALVATAHRKLVDADALEAHWLLPSGAVAAMIARGRPFGVVAHSSAARWFLAAPHPLRWLAARPLRHATWLSATDPAVAGALQRACGVPTYWIGPDTLYHPLMTLPLAQPQRRLRLGCLGRRGPIKGLDLLLKAAADAGKHGAIEVLIAGPGPAVSSRPWVQDWGTIHGPESIRDFFAAIDVLVIPSRNIGARTEGLPSVLLESWAAGRPVLASAVGGMQTLVPKSWRFAADDQPALVALINALANDRSRIASEALQVRKRLNRVREQWARRRTNAASALIGHLVPIRG